MDQEEEGLIIIITVVVDAKLREVVLVEVPGGRMEAHLHRDWAVSRACTEI